MELGGPDTPVGARAVQGGPIRTWKASGLMPYYPMLSYGAR